MYPGANRLLQKQTKPILFFWLLYFCFEKNSGWILLN